MCPYNGSDGTYTLSDTIAPATLADANELQAILNDIQTALTAVICKDGESTITGPLKGFAGTVALPGYSFSADSDSGLYRIGANNLGMALGGAKVVDYATTGISITGTLGSSGNVAVATNKFTVDSTNGNTVVAGTLGVTGALTVTGASNFTATLSCSSALMSGILKLTGTDCMKLANGTTAQRNGSAVAGDARYNSTLNGMEYYNGTAWIIIGQAPTLQRFTSGTSATYTPATGVARIRVRMVGGGGGGGAQTTNNGANGTTSVFGSWTAIFGSGGALGDNSAGGAGGTGGATGTGTLITRADGADGGTGNNNASHGQPGVGGNSAFFGGGGTAGVDNTAGKAAKANTGGGGAGANGSGSVVAGAGGGAGESVEFWVNGPSATTYTVGALGAGGAAGGKAGGDGGAGIIIVEEFYS